MSTTTPSRVARAAPPALHTLVERFDHDRFDLPGMRAIVRLSTTDGGSWDVVIDRKNITATGGRREANRRRKQEGNGNQEG